MRRDQVRDLLLDYDLAGLNRDSGDNRRFQLVFPGGCPWSIFQCRRSNCTFAPPVLERGLDLLVVEGLTSFLFV